MKITRNNYEPFFIDYLEGNLEESLVDEFIGFIQENPDLKDELLLFDSLKLPALSVTLKKKDRLYKERLDSEMEFEHTAIAAIEGDLTQEESEELEDYLKRNPERRNEVLQFEKTKLIPETVVFTKKNSLYKRILTRTVFLWSARAAAVLILFWVASVMILKRPDVTNTNNQQVANRIEKQELKKNIPEQDGNQITVPSKAEKTIQNIQNPAITGQQEIHSSQPVAVKEPETVREALPSPACLVPLRAGLMAETPQLSLAWIEPFEIDNPIQPENDERLIADVIREKINKEGFSFKKLVRSGLDLASKLSNEKFTYNTSQDGRITEYAFDSRLLGFSIPSGK